MTKPDYETVKRVWQILGEMQQQEKDREWFPITGELLTKLGLDDMNQLRGVLDELDNYGYHWRPGGSLFVPGKLPPSGQIVHDQYLVITPKFLDDYNDFVKIEVTNEQEEKQG